MQGLEVVKGFISGIFIAFPDFHGNDEVMVAEGDKVAVRSNITDSFEGPFGEIPPTGQKTTWTVTAIYRLKDGKIAEIWEDVDMLGAFQRYRN